MRMRKHMCKGFVSESIATLEVLLSRTPCKLETFIYYLHLSHERVLEKGELDHRVGLLLCMCVSEASFLCLDSSPIVGPHQTVLKK